MVELQDQINEFEKELEEHGMQINNITMSAAIDGGTDEYALYSIVHYSLRTGGEQSQQKYAKESSRFYRHPHTHSNAKAENGVLYVSMPYTLTNTRIR